MNETIYISVILPLKLEWEPCYYLPSDIGPGQVRVGSRVKVSFASKEYPGVISAVGVHPETALSKIKAITSIEEGMENVLPEEIELWRRVADYYLCTIGEVYKAAYPTGKINLEEARAAAITKSRQRKEKILASMKARIDRIEARLARKEELTSRSRTGTKAHEKYSEDAERIRLELKIAQDAYIAAEQSSKTASEYLDSHCSEGMTPDRISLSDAQTAAYDEIRKGFDAGKPVMLHGVTGSGKTEIYIKLAQEALGKGKNILYMVPEIALSRQLEDRLNEHFGNMLMTFHSGETSASKRNTAETIRAYKDSGSNYIVLGTRSSIFLPHHNLGLIIVDEEHDTSYKQDSPAPRYNGRDAALMLSVIHKCSIILGSATPSLEEIYNCRCGKHRLVDLKEKYHSSEISEIEIIDTKAERRKRGMHGNFSRKLIDHIRKTLEKGEQVMILRSRRAWAPALQCEECGEIPKCPHCNVSLSCHKNGNSQHHMTCHYCGFKASFTGRCIKCGGTLKSLGAGTQKIEEEAALLFPSARIARLDSDTAQNKAYETKIIKEFGKGEIDILIGTQMLAKGFDFSSLSLVAVIAADTLLGIQDFRADEKALQLMEQFRGRCGRRDRKGLFVIQTSQPEHPIYQRIQSNESASFCNDLMAEREAFLFPPYSRIIEITVKDKYEDRVERMSRRLADMLRSEHHITGPYTPVIDKIADQFIRSIRISLKKDRTLKSRKDSIQATVMEFEKNLKYQGHIIIDVDPS